MTSWALIVYPARCDNWINALDNDCSAMWSDSISQIEEPWMFWQHQHDSSEPRVNNYRLPPVQACPPVTSTLWTRWSQTNCQQPLWPPKIILTKKLDAWFQFRAAAECFWSRAWQSGQMEETKHSLHEQNHLWKVILILSKQSPLLKYSRTSLV